MPGTEIVKAGRPRPAKRYFPDSYYSMHADTAMEQRAQISSLPTPWRLYFLAVARANVWGHAAFDDGEITRLLGIPHSTRKRAIEKLKKYKIIAPESDAYCLALNAADIRRADRKTKTCLSRRHDRLNIARCLWVCIPGLDPEWVPREDWDERLNSEDGRERIRVTMEQTSFAGTKTALTIEGPGIGQSSPEVLAALAAQREAETRARQSARCARCGGFDNGSGLCWECEQDEKAATAERERAASRARWGRVGAASAGDSDHDGPAF